MSDQNRGAGDEEGSEDAEKEGDEYEVERPVTRKEGAAVLRRLADGVANGSVELDDGNVIAAVPEQFELEIEYEQDDERTELEAELEWPVEAEAVAAAQESEARESGDTETADAGDDKEPTDEEKPAAEADPERPTGEIVGIGDTASKAQFELYRDRAHEWRWRLVHDNGNIIADSGEGYDRKATARNGLESVMRNAPGATVVETDD